MSCRKSLFPAIYHVPKLNETYQNQHPKIMLRHREYHTNMFAFQFTNKHLEVSRRIFHKYLLKRLQVKNILLIELIEVHGKHST